MAGHKGKSKNVHIICCVLAVLFSFLIFIKNQIADYSPLPSNYYDDLVLSEDNRSILDECTLEMVHAKLDGLRIYEMQRDPQLHVRAQDEDGWTIHGIVLIIKEPFLVDVECKLYYPNTEDRYTEDCSDKFTLPAGERVVYLSVPEEVPYKLQKFRIDIDKPYEIEDIRILPEMIRGTYTPDPRKGRFLFFIYPIVIFVLAEVFYYMASMAGLFAGDLGLRFRWSKKGVLWSLAGVAAAAFGGWILSIPRHLPYSWYWFFFILVLWFAFGIQVYLFRLNADKGRMVRENIPAIAGMTALIIVVIFFWQKAAGAVQFQEADMKFHLMYASGAAECVLLTLLYGKYVKRIEPDGKAEIRIFAFILILLSAGYMVIFLPYISPDETSHYVSSYRIANFLLGRFCEAGNDRLVMRMEDFLLYDKNQTLQTAEYFTKTIGELKAFAAGGGSIAINAPLTSNALFSYLPQAMGIALGKLLNLSGAVTFFLGRTANIAFFILCALVCMRRYSRYRLPMFVICTMPMTLHMAASYSYDTATFCFVFLFAFKVMDLLENDKACTNKDLLDLLILGALLGPSKLVYIPLLMLVVLLPSGKLAAAKSDGMKKKLLIIAVGLLSTILFTLAVNLIGESGAIRNMVQESATENIVAWAGEPGYTISWILHHPFSYLGICLNTVIMMADYYFFTMVGARLGWLNIETPYVFVVVIAFLFYLSIQTVTEKDEKASLSVLAKFWISLLCLGSVMLTFLAMALDWTPLSYDHIMGVQGRYFLPLLVPVIWLLKNRLISVKGGFSKIVIYQMTWINMWILMSAFSSTFSH